MNYRYLVFSGKLVDDGPGGGWDDFVSAHAELDNAFSSAIHAVQEMPALVRPWAHIVDTSLLRTVAVLNG